MNHGMGGVTANTAQKKKFGRFNGIDFLLLVVIVLLIAAVIYVFAPFSKIRDWMSNETYTLEYTVEILGVDEEFIEKIKEKDVVVDSVSKNTLGTVTAVDYNNKYTELQIQQKEDQSIVGILSEYPNKYNVIVTISATADYAEGSGYSVNNCRVAVGEKLSLRFPDYVCEGYCIALDPLQ